MSKRRPSRFKRFLAHTVPLVLLAVAGWRAVDTLLFEQRALEAEATVTSVETWRGDEGETFYRPSVVFRIEDGRLVTKKFFVGHNTRREVGDRFTIRYDPSDLTDVRYTDFFRNWGLAIALGILGVGWLIMMWVFRGAMALQRKRVAQRSA